MKHFIILFLLLGSFFLPGCAPDEKILNSVIDKWVLLTTTPGGAQINTTPVNDNQAGTISTRYTASGTISSIAEYRNYVFLMIPTQYKVLILDRTRFVPVDSIDFSDKRLIPSGVAFGNATTIYFSHENDSVVTIYDLFNFKKAGTITVGKNPTGIVAGNGERQNQIFVANRGSATVSQIDTRTNTVVATYPVGKAPVYIMPDLSGKKIVVACMGAGKNGETGVEKTTPSLAFIDIDARTVARETPISTGEADSALAIPMGLAVTKSDWAFVPLSNGLVRVDTREYIAIAVISKEMYSGISYNLRRDELLCVKDRTVSVLDENSGDLKFSPLELSIPILQAIGQ
jgi:YVTN family beta-propeller protein